MGEKHMRRPRNQLFPTGAKVEIIIRFSGALGLIALHGFV